jgi:outer membrane protein
LGAREKIYQVKIDQENAYFAHYPRLSVLGNVNRNSIWEEISYDSSVRMLFPLFLGGRIYYGHQSAKSITDKVRAEFFISENNLKLNVQIAYYNLDFAKKTLIVAEQDLKNYQAHRALTDTLQKIGLASEADLLRVDSEITRSQDRLEQAQNAINQSKFVLMTLMAIRTEAKDFDIMPAPNYELDGPIETKYAYEGAKERRPELKAIERAIYASRYDEKREASGFYPSLQLDTRYGYTNNPRINGDFGAAANSDGIKPIWDSYWQVTLQLEFNLFDWGTVRRNVDKARSRTKEIMTMKEDFLNTLFREVEQSAHELERSKSSIELMAEALAKSQKAYDQTIQNYQMGNATNLDVLTAEDALNQARLEHLRALNRRYVAESAYKHAIGRP